MYQQCIHDAENIKANHVEKQHLNEEVLQRKTMNEMQLGAKSAQTPCHRKSEPAPTKKSRTTNTTDEGRYDIQLSKVTSMLNQEVGKHKATKKSRVSKGKKPEGKSTNDMQLKTIKNISRRKSEPTSTKKSRTPKTPEAQFGYDMPTSSSAHHQDTSRQHIKKARRFKDSIQEIKQDERLTTPTLESQRVTCSFKDEVQKIKGENDLPAIIITPDTPSSPK